MLTLFVVLQLCLDVQLVLVVLWLLRRRRAAPRRLVAPSWFAEFRLLVEEVRALVEPALDALEADEARAHEPVAAAKAAAALEPAAALKTAAPEPAARTKAAAPAPDARPAAPARPAEAPAPRDRRREALALLRAGVAPEEVERRERLLPGEARLIRNLAAAEARLGPVSAR